MMMDVFAGLVEGIALNLGQPFDQEFLQRPMIYIQHNRPECGLQQILKFAILTNGQLIKSTPGHVFFRLAGRGGFWIFSSAPLLLHCLRFSGKDPGVDFMS